MAKAEATVEELVGMIDRGELRLPEMQRRYVWRSTRVRDLLDSLYRGYPSGGSSPLSRMAGKRTPFVHIAQYVNRHSSGSVPWTRLFTWYLKMVLF